MATITTSNSYLAPHSSHRSVAMLLSLTVAVVLSPLYVKRKADHTRYENRWGSGFALPMVLGGLIIAIRAVSSSSSLQRSNEGGRLFPSMDEPSLVLKIGSSSWGLAGVLIMLILVLSWQDSVKGFLWR